MATLSHTTYVDISSRRIGCRPCPPMSQGCTLKLGRVDVWRGQTLNSRVKHQICMEFAWEKLKKCSKKLWFFDVWRSDASTTENLVSTNDPTYGPLTIYSFKFFQNFPLGHSKSFARALLAHECKEDRKFYFPPKGIFIAFYVQLKCKTKELRIDTTHNNSWNCIFQKSFSYSNPTFYLPRKYPQRKPSAAEKKLDSLSFCAMFWWLRLGAIWDRRRRQENSAASCRRVDMSSGVGRYE